MALSRKNLSNLAQPIPYFASQIAQLVDFDIEVTVTKKASKGALKRTIKKCRIEAIDGSPKDEKILKKLIEATIPNYALKLSRGQIELNA
jgi:hypothetical protein